MNVFEFLSRIKQEHFEHSIKCTGWCHQFIEVTVNAYFEIWVVRFNEEGLDSFEVFCLNKDTELEIGERDVDKDVRKEIYESLKEHFSKQSYELEDLFERPAKTWIKASEDLGITFITPYQFTSLQGEQLQATGLLPQFGFGLGSLITSRYDDDEVCIEAGRLNKFSMSALSPFSYDRYNRENIIETLVDWGWIGEGDPPDWYTEYKEKEPEE